MRSVRWSKLTTNVCWRVGASETPYRLAVQSFIKDVVLSILTVPILVGAFTDRIGLNDKRTGMFMISGSLVLIYLFGELMLEWNFPVLFAAISYAVTGS